MTEQEEDNHHRLWKLIEFVRENGGHMLQTRNPRAVRFVLPDAAVHDAEEMLEADRYIVTSTSPTIFKREYVVDLRIDETQRLLDELEERPMGH
jgi:hypothetical protein